jgi:hypothetical protein
VFNDFCFFREIQACWEANREDPQARFQYACVLSKSPDERERRMAISHFDHLVRNDQFVRDSIYNLALTEYSIGEFEFARVHCEDIYRQDPDNQQVLNCYSWFRS